MNSGVPIDRVKSFFISGNLRSFNSIDTNKRINAGGTVCGCVKN